MNKKEEKIFAAVSVAAVVLALYFIPISNGYLGLLLAPYTAPNWDEVLPRNIVKNAIPITLIEKNDGQCTVTAQKFDIIIDHVYFKRGDELAKNLNYDREHQTITLPCDMLKGEKSKLNIWYALEESPKHSKKYQYFITEWNGTSPIP